MYAWWKVGFGLGFHKALREAKGFAHLVEGTRGCPAGFCCRGYSSLMKGPMKIWRRGGGQLDQVECRALIPPASVDARMASTTRPTSTITINLAQHKMAARLGVGAGATGIVVNGTQALVSLVIVATAVVVCVVGWDGRGGTAGAGGGKWGNDGGSA